MGDMLNRTELMRKIQELSFYAVDLNLFLDTHPNNAQALQDYARVLNSLQDLKRIYNQQYGPLKNFGEAYVGGNFWQWVAEDERWPWEGDLAL